MNCMTLQHILLYFNTFTGIIRFFLIIRENSVVIVPVHVLLCKSKINCNWDQLMVNIISVAGEGAWWGVAYIARWKKMSEASDSEKGSYIQALGFLRAHG